MVRPWVARAVWRLCKVTLPWAWSYRFSELTFCWPLWFKKRRASDAEVCISVPWRRDKKNGTGNAGGQVVPSMQKNTAGLQREGRVTSQIRVNKKYAQTRCGDVTYFSILIHLNHENWCARKVAWWATNANHTYGLSFATQTQELLLISLLGQKMDEGMQIKVWPQFWDVAADDNWSMMTGSKGN